MLTTLEQQSYYDEYVYFILYFSRPDKRLQRFCWKCVFFSKIAYPFETLLIFRTNICFALINQKN